MKKPPFLFPLALLCVAALASVGRAAEPPAPTAAAPAKPTEQFRLLSSDLLPRRRLAETHVFDGFGRHGQNLSPHLRWENPPAGTKSFAVTLFDPDAPTGSGWWHWVLIDLPATTRELPRGAGSPSAERPAGARQMRTDFGTHAYGGAAPPPGTTHRYFFTVHALDVARLEVPDDATAAMVSFFLRTHSLGTAKLVVLYGP